MIRNLVAVAVGVASFAFAQGPAADKQAPKVAVAKEDKKPQDAKPEMDLSKAGPWARKPTNEAATKKEIADFFKEEEALAAKGDHEAMVARVDFPVFMVTDDAKGAVEAKPWSKDEYVTMMKPFFENMPKDVKYTHKTQVTVLSDSLANVVDEFTMTSGKMKLAGRNMGLLVKVAGSWKWKTMAEAGWGGMPAK